MSGPLVSLIMPAWRPRPDWLAQAVTAALDQRESEVEVLVVDDGSPEPVADLLSDFDDARLRPIRVEHGGAAHAKNAGMAEAGGEYLRFIDADDVIEPESTRELLALTEGRSDLIAYGATLFCDEELQPLWTMTSSLEGDAVIACLLGRFTTRPHAFLFPRPVLDATGVWNPEMSVSEDWDFILRALEHAPVRGTQSVATRYRRHGGGLTSDPAEAERGAREVVARYFERHPDQRGTALERKARAMVEAHAGRVYATHGQLGRGLGRLARAAATDPGAVLTQVRQARAPVAAMLKRRLSRRSG